MKLTFEAQSYLMVIFHSLNLCLAIARDLYLQVGENRLPVISDLDHFGPGYFGRLSVISDGDFGRCAVKLDGDFGRCVVNSDAAVNSDGDFGRCAVNSDA